MLGKERQRLRAWGLQLRFASRYYAGRLMARLRRHQLGVRTVVVFGVAATLAWAINSTASPVPTPSSNDVAILTAVGAMFGGVLAIVLALSTFILQRAADLYSAHLYELYARDWRDKLVFVLIACLAIIAFALAILQGTAHVPLRRWVITDLALVMTATVFALVDWHYTSITKKVNPVSAIEFAETQGLKTLATLHSFAIDIAAWLVVSNESLTKEQALALSYRQYVSPYIATVDRRLENLFEISVRLFTRGENLAAQRGLAATRNILQCYLQLRRDSFVAIPVPEYWGVLESDSANFLAKNYERLNAVADVLMKEGRSESVVFLVDLYESLVSAAREVDFVNRRGLNPVLDQLQSNVSSLIDAAIRSDDINVCFRSIRVPVAVGKAVVERKFGGSTLARVFSDIANIGTWGVNGKRTVYLKYCVEPIADLISDAVKADIPDLRFVVGEGLRRLQTLFLLTHVAAVGRLVPDTDIEFKVGQGYSRLAQNIGSLTEAISSQVEGREKTRAIANLDALFDLTYRSLRSLSEIVKNCDAAFVIDITALIDVIIRCSIRLSEDAEEQNNLHRRDRFEHHLSWFTNLPYWFVHHAPSFDSTHAFGLLADLPITTGLRLIERNAWHDKAVDSANAAFAITKAMLAKGRNRHGYDEPRHLLSICFLAVLARAKSCPSIVADTVLAMIREFEESYAKAYIANGEPESGERYRRRPTQLLTEAIHWRDRFEHAKYNRPPVMNRSEDHILRLVSVDDVDRFLYEVWGVIPKYGRVADEIKRPVLEQLVAALTRRIASLGGL